MYSQYKKECLAALRRAPIRLMLPGLLAGQLAGFFRSEVLAWVVLWAALFGFFLIFRRFRLLILAWMALGCFSTWLAAPDRQGVELSEDITYAAVVDEPPRRRKAGGVEVSLLLEEALLPGASAASSSGQRVLCRAAELPWRNLNAAELGQRYLIRAKFRSVRKTSSPVSFDSKLYRNGYNASCKIRFASRPLAGAESRLAKMRSSLFGLVRSEISDSRLAALFLSMAFGARDVLSDRVERSYKVAGLSHLLVFSGAQVMLVYYFVRGICALVLRLSFGRTSSLWFYLSSLCPLKRIFSLLGFCAALVSCLVAGFEPSAMRAAISASVLVMGDVLERPVCLFDSILLSLFVLALIWPGCYFEPGVQLTYAALYGICLASYFGAGTRSWLGQYLRCCTFAWLFTAPVCYLWFGQFSLFGLPFNFLFSAPLAFFSCNLGYAAVLLNLLEIDSSGRLLRLCAWVLGMLNDLILKLVAMLEEWQSP